MTTALAELLAARLRPLPFLARVVGLARVVDKVKTEDFGDDKQGRRTRTPVPLTYPPGADACAQDDEYLLPDLRTPSILFFEDQGTVDYQAGSGIVGKESTLRLLAWFNPKCFADPLNENQLLDAILAALKVRQRATVGDYDGLTITATVLPAEAALFNKYTYATDYNPQLYPPYLVLGVELKCRYLYRPECPTLPLPTFKDYAPC